MAARLRTIRESDSHCEIGAETALIYVINALGLPASSAGHLRRSARKISLFGFLASNFPHPLIDRKAAEAIAFPVKKTIRQLRRRERRR